MVKFTIGVFLLATVILELAIVNPVMIGSLVSLARADLYLKHHN